MKGKGGVIGLMDNQAALQRWMICVAKIAKGLSEFENEVTADKSLQNGTHHEEDLATQKRFQEECEKSSMCSKKIWKSFLRQQF